MDQSPLELIESRITVRSAPALTQTITDLISGGVLAAGDRLPTVRDVAEQIGMSRSAVGEAWKELMSRGLVETRRRGGTIVLGKPRPPRALRYESMIRSTASGARDLANARTDSLPFPDLTRAVTWAVSQPDLHNPFAERITPALFEAVRDSWRYTPDRFIATHGLMDGVEMALSILVNPGDTVLVESPCHGRVLDVLEAVGARAIPIPYGVDGPELDTLRRALASKPAAFIYQPTRQIPAGRSVSAEWIAAAAELLPETLPVLELSQLGLLRDDQQTLGTRLPKQVTQFRSYNLFFGADMRISVIGGASDLIDAMWMRLTYSTRFVSRILQETLAFLLTDPDVQAQTAIRSSEITRRFEALAGALRSHGFQVEDSLGPCIWLRVPDDHSVCTRLSQEGIVVHPGRFFQAQPVVEECILVNSTAVGGDHEEVAAIIAAAAAPFGGAGAMQRGASAPID